MIGAFEDERELTPTFIRGRSIAEKSKWQAARITARQL